MSGSRMPRARYGLAVLFGCLALAALPARADGWAVDHERSRLGFQFVESGNPVSGTFGRWSAEIRYDPANPAAARLRVEVDTASAATGERRRDELLTGQDWLDSARARVALFEAEGFRPLGDNRYEASGTLRLRDGVRPVTLAFSLGLAGDAARVLGRTTLIRTQFGVGQGQWGGMSVVGVEVAVTFELQARRLR